MTQTTKAFIAAWKADPFRPFLLRLSSGEFVPVSHPECVMREPESETFIVGHSGGQYSIIAMTHLASIELFKPGAKLPTRKPTE
jgi:hypothetical protein